MAVENRGFTTTDGIDINEVYYNTVLPIIDIYNAEEVLDIRTMVCIDGDESYYKFPVNTAKWKFQKLGEVEKPTSHKLVWGKRQKDTEKYGLGITYTFDWLMSEQASSDQIARMAAKAVATDRDLQTAVIIENCLKSASSDGFYAGASYYDTNEKQDRPQPYGNNVFLTTHTHYNATGSATLRVSDLTAAKEHLKEHGWGAPFVGFCNADFIKKLEDLIGLFITTTANYASLGQAIPDQTMREGFKGSLLGINWVETEWMPDDYFLIIASKAGEDKPVRFIQKKNPSAQGLILVPGSYNVQYPLIEASYLRWFTTQVLYRAAGYVGYITASSYSDPDLISNVVDT
jgi:hypothetical protein